MPAPTHTDTIVTATVGDEESVGARVFDFKTGSFWDVPCRNVVLPAARAYHINPRAGRWRSSQVGTEGPAALIPYQDIALGNLGVLLFNGGEAYAKECLADGRTPEDGEDMYEYVETHSRRCIWVIKVCFGGLEVDGAKGRKLGTSLYFPLTYTQASQLKQTIRTKASMFDGNLDQRMKLFHLARFAPSYGWVRTVQTLTTTDCISRSSELPLQDNVLRLDLLFCNVLRRWGEHFKRLQNRKMENLDVLPARARVRQAVIADFYSVATARAGEWAKKVAAAYEPLFASSRQPDPISPASIMSHPPAPVRRELTPPNPPSSAKRRLQATTEVAEAKRAKVDQMKRTLAMPMSSAASAAMMAGHDAVIGGGRANTTDRTNPNRASMEVLDNDVLTHIGTYLLKTDPMAACALRLASKGMNRAVEGSMIDTLHQAECNLKTCLRGNSVSDVAASADSIAEDGMDALKLLHRVHKKTQERRGWSAADFGHVTFSGYSGGNPLCKLKHVAPVGADSQWE